METSLIVLTPEQLRQEIHMAFREEIGAAFRDMARPTEVFTEKEAAVYLKLSPVTLRQYRSQSRGPVYTKGERGVRYLKKDLDAFMAKNRVSTADCHV